MGDNIVEVVESEQLARVHLDANEDANEDASKVLLKEELKFLDSIIVGVLVAGESRPRIL
ncbi:MAG: hypothetical protein ACJA2Q_000648 [Pseudohongiellaceae bacterium]